MSDLLRTVAIIVLHTPVWVWGLYGLLLILGLQRTRDSTVSLARMLILPFIVVILGILSFVAAGASALPVMLVGLAIGGTAGWRLEREGATRRLADSKIWLRGEWWTFTQIVVVLAFRYATNVVPVVAPALNADPIWHMGSLSISAALSAIFVGRTAVRLKVWLTA